MDTCQNSYDLHPVWNAIIDVYKVVAQICERNNLRYWAAFGTALGAVRHHGFIPWDDDLDLMMPREDYDRFMVIAEGELPTYMKTVTIYNTREFHWGFGKVQDCREEVLERVHAESSCRLPDGIYVDIFPLDGCLSSPVARLGRKVKSACAHLRKRNLLDRGCPWVSRAAGGIAGVFLPRLRTIREFKLYDLQRLRRPMMEGAVRCGFLVDEISREFCHRPLQVASFSQTVKTEFEDVLIPIPQDVDGILRVWYGDYMKLPPVEKRQIPSHANDPLVSWRLGPTGLC